MQVQVCRTTIFRILSRADICPPIKLMHDRCNLFPNTLTISQLDCCKGIRVCHREDWCMGDQFLLSQSVVFHRVISFRATSGFSLMMYAKGIPVTPRQPHKYSSKFSMFLGQFDVSSGGSTFCGPPPSCDVLAIVE